MYDLGQVYSDKSEEPLAPPVEEELEDVVGCEDDLHFSMIHASTFSPNICIKKKENPRKDHVGPEAFWFIFLLTATDPGRLSDLRRTGEFDVGGGHRRFAPRTWRIGKAGKRIPSRLSSASDFSKSYMQDSSLGLS